jgi:hypothetical protein
MPEIASRYQPGVEGKEEGRWCQKNSTILKGEIN